MQDRRNASLLLGLFLLSLANNLQKKVVGGKVDGIYWNIAEGNVGGENGRNELIIEESESEKELCWSCEGSSGPLDGCLHLHSWSQTIRSGHLTLSDPRNSFKTLEIVETL